MITVDAERMQSAAVGYHVKRSRHFNFFLLLKTKQRAAVKKMQHEKS